MSRDPIGYRGGISLYQFVSSNPIARTDPLGMASLDMPPLRPGMPWVGVWGQEYDFGVVFALTRPLATDVTCGCKKEELECLTGPCHGYRISCTIRIRLRIELAIDQVLLEILSQTIPKDESLLEWISGLYGHEQLHYSNVYDFASDLVDGLTEEEEGIGYYCFEKDCKYRAQRVEDKFQKLLDDFLWQEFQHLANEHPQDGVGYPPSGGVVPPIWIILPAPKPPPQPPNERPVTDPFL